MQTIRAPAAAASVGGNDASHPVIGHLSADAVAAVSLPDGTAAQELDPRVMALA